MSSHFTSFAVAGGTGQIGNNIAASLLSHGLRVVVLTRSSSSKVAEGAEARVVASYDDVDTLAKALEGVEVVINALGQESLAGESGSNLARAAKKAGAELVLANHWGVDLETIKKGSTGVHPFLLGKLAFPSFVNELGLAYLQIHIGLLTSSFPHLTSVDAEKKTATIVGPGDTKFTITSEKDVGQFVGDVFAKLPKKDLLNQTLGVSGRVATLNELLAGYDVTHVDPKEATEQSRDVAGLGVKSFFTWLLLIIHTGESVIKPDNERVGFVAQDTAVPL